MKVICPKDKVELVKLGAKKVSRILKKKKKVTFQFPMYECPKCNIKYTLLESYDNNVMIRLGNDRYCNISPSINERRYINTFLLYITAESKCYVHGTTKGKVCRSCGKKLEERKVEFLDEKGERVFKLTKYCEKCKAHHVPYSMFNQAVQAKWELMNQEEIPAILKELEIKKEENKQKHERKKERKRLEKELRLMREQEEKEKRAAKLKEEQEEKERKAAEADRYNDEDPGKGQSLYEHDNNIRVEDFVIRRTTFRCLHKEHQLRNIQGNIDIIDKDGNVKQVSVPAGYCPNCNLFFIMESTYQVLKSKGTPRCRVSDEKTYLKSGFAANGMRLARESILMQYGYSVSQEEGLTTVQRRKILVNLVDDHVLTRTDIISYLDFFISQRSRQPKYEKAIEKWGNDREFISEYRAGSYTQYGISGIYRK